MLMYIASFATVSEANMTQEEKDFIYFKENQLYNICYETGMIDVIRTVIHHKGKPYQQRRYNVGHKNEDGYIRVWCNGKLRMKHRLIYFLFHGEMPNEIDHIDRVRDNNAIVNLRSVTRSENNYGSVRGVRRRFTKQELTSICELIAEDRYTDQHIADIHKCSRIAIMGIRHKRRHAEFSDDFFK